MFKNYLTVAFRNIFRGKANFFINITGLAIGMAVCLLLFLWVRDEWGYDRFHENAERIYRITAQYESEGVIKRSACTPAPLAPVLTAEFPEVEKAVRLGENGFLVSYLDKCFKERVFFADAEVFDVFTMPLTRGDPDTALNEPYSIIISERIRYKYFGNDNPIGKTINLKGLHDFKITGILKTIPQNSHLKFDFLGSFLDYAGNNAHQWGISNYYTYILMSENSSLQKFKAKLPQFVKKYRGEEAVTDYKISYPPQPLTRIHLYSHLGNEIEPNGDISTVYIFSTIALFILLIACLNYINLSTALYIKREKEIGLRRVFGALRKQLITQFLSEGFLFSLAALPLAVLLTNLFLPVFNSISGKQLSVHFFDNPVLAAGLTAVFLCVGFISGFFPALFISYLQALRALRGTFRPGSKIDFLRKLLVIFQFSISIIFIISALTVWNQLNYIKKKDLGFDKGHILNIPIYRTTAREKYDTIKNELLRDTGVGAVSANAFSPENPPWNVNYWREGLDPEENPMINFIIVDHDFIKTFRVKFFLGRDFSKQFPADIEGSYIINKSALKEFGWESPIGKKFKLGIGKEGTIVGVVENFHFRSLHHEIKPLVLYISPKWFNHFSIRLTANDIPRVLDSLENLWKKLVPDQSFQYSFLDETIDRIYKTETRLSKLFFTVTILALFIACLGLFGLASFTSEQRTKEIGIRKVLGASTAGVVLLLSKKFSLWVLVSYIAACPVAFYIMNRWLQNFASQAGIEIWTFFLAGLIVLVTALLTLSWKVVAAATADPVKSLRYE